MIFDQRRYYQQKANGITTVCGGSDVRSFLPKIALVLLALSVFSCTRSQEDASMDRVLEAIFFKTRDQNAILAELDQCRKKCSPEEKSLAVEIKDTVLPIVSSIETLHQRASELDAVFIKALKVYEGHSDSKNYLSTVKTAMLHAQQKQMIRAGDEEFVKSLIASLEKYISVHENSKEAHAHLAQLHAGFEQKDHLEASLKYSKKCLSLDKQHGPCRDAYLKAKNLYTTPRCSGEQIKSDFRIALGNKVEKTGPQTLSFKGHQFTLGVEKPIPLKSAAKAVRLMSEGGGGMLDIELSEAGSTQLQNYTQSKEGRALLFVLKNEILGVIRISSEPLKAYFFSVEIPSTKNAGTVFKDFCDQYKEAVLPQDLVVNL